MKNRLLHLALAGALFFLAALPAFAMDFGGTVVLQNDASGADSQDPLNTLTTAINPWFSMGINEQFQIYASGSLSFKHFDGEMVKPLPLFELARTEFVYRPMPGFVLQLGRMPFRDSLGFTASGLYDGFQGAMDLGPGRLALGYFYTGLLYRKTAEILMNVEDAEDYYAEWDWEEFSPSYFASRRTLGSLRWDMPLVESLQDTLTLEVLAQTDVNDHDNFFHSQYAELGYTFQPHRYLGLSLGGIAEIMENEPAKEDIQAAFGGVIEARSELPTPMTDRLAIGGRWVSGKWNDTFIEFTPLKRQPMGQVFDFHHSMAALNLNYDIRIINSLFAAMAFRYFIRTDGASQYLGGEEKDAIALGGEIYGSLAFSPLDDLALTVGGGVFIPAMGNVYKSDVEPSWKVSAGLVLSF